MKNKYARRSKISEGKVRELVRYFAADLTALQAATPSGLNRNTVNRFYRGLRERILLDCEARRPLFGVVEVDESLFGARRVEGRRGRGAYGKTVVFGIFEPSRPSLHGDCPGLLKADPAGHHPRPSGPQYRHQLRWLARLQRAGRSRLRSLPRRSFQRRVR